MRSGATPVEIVAEIDPQDAPMVELNVLRAPGKEEYTRIAFFKNRGFSNRVFGSDHHQSLISLDTSYSSVAPDVLSRAPETAPVVLAPGETLKLRIFVDKSVVEVFANGQQCVGRTSLSRPRRQCWGFAAGTGPERRIGLARRLSDAGHLRRIERNTP